MRRADFILVPFPCDVNSGTRPLSPRGTVHTEKSFTARDAKAAKEQNSLTAKDAEVAKEKPYREGRKGREGDNNLKPNPKGAKTTPRGHTRSAAGIESTRERFETRIFAPKTRF